VTAPADTPSPADVSRWELTLYVSGASDLSGRAISDVTRHCETHLPGRYVLSVVDLHEDPEAVLRNNVLVAPTLIRDMPLPSRRVVGDLSQAERVRAALDLPVPVDRAAGGKRVST